MHKPIMHPYRYHDTRGPVAWQQLSKSQRSTPQSRTACEARGPADTSAGLDVWNRHLMLPTGGCYEDTSHAWY